MIEKGEGGSKIHVYFLFSICIRIGDDVYGLCMDSTLGTAEGMIVRVHKYQP